MTSRQNLCHAQLLRIGEPNTFDQTQTTIIELVYNEDNVWTFKVPTLPIPKPIVYRCIYGAGQEACIVRVQESRVAVKSSCQFRIVASSTDICGKMGEWVYVSNSKSNSEWTCLETSDVVSFSVCLEISRPHGS